MANQNGLRLIGWAYGGLAATVGIIGFLVVSAQINAEVQARSGTEARFARLP